MIFNRFNFEIFFIILRSLDRNFESGKFFRRFFKRHDFSRRRRRKTEEESLDSVPDHKRNGRNFWLDRIFNFCLFDGIRDKKQNKRRMVDLFLYFGFDFFRRLDFFFADQIWSVDKKSNFGDWKINLQNFSASFSAKFQIYKIKN